MSVPLDFLSFRKNVSFYICVSVREGVSIHTHVQVPTGAKRVSDPLEPELEALVNP